jgi:hypothetical protein
MPAIIALILAIIVASWLSDLSAPRMQTSANECVL